MMSFAEFLMLFGWLVVLLWESDSQEEDEDREEDGGDNDV